MSFINTTLRYSGSAIGTLSDCCNKITNEMVNSIFSKVEQLLLTDLALPLIKTKANAKTFPETGSESDTNRYYLRESYKYTNDLYLIVSFSITPYFLNDYSAKLSIYLSSMEVESNTTDNVALSDTYVVCDDLVNMSATQMLQEDTTYKVTCSINIPLSVLNTQHHKGIFNYSFISAHGGYFFIFSADSGIFAPSSGYAFKHFCKDGEHFDSKEVCVVTIPSINISDVTKCFVAPVYLAKDGVLQSDTVQTGMLLINQNTLNSVGNIINIENINYMCIFVFDTYSHASLCIQID